MKPEKSKSINDFYLERAEFYEEQAKRVINEYAQRFGSPPRGVSWTEDGSEALWEIAQKWRLGVLGDADENQS